MSVVTKPYFRIYGRHLEKSIWRNNSDDFHLIITKSGGQKFSMEIYFRLLKQVSHVEKPSGKNY